MSELLLELFCEEIPSRMQKRAQEDFARLVTAGLSEAGLSFEGVRSYSTPRRLSLVIDGVPPKSSDVREERKGPRVDAPDKALEGFLRSTGLTLEECEIHDDKKGQFYVAVIDREGQQTPHILMNVVTNVVRTFPWPKAMRWGSGRLKWVRPLHSILCVFNGKAVKFMVDGVPVGRATQGHRFLGGKPFKVKSFEEYKEKLLDQFVVLDPDQRAEKILKDAKALARKRKLTLVEDEGLLKEVAGLVEWPVVLMGSFDKEFLDVPPEVLMSAMKTHQKYFSLQKQGQLTNRFLLVSNMEAEDDGEAIIAGNERVIRARLSDAKFFWDNDLKTPLEALLPQLKEIVFHAKLGTVAERVERLEALSGVIAPLVGADKVQAQEAARLAKADLVSETVCESPDMQGIAGRYLALAQGKPEAIANAIAGHYKPQGPSDEVPSEPVSIAVALADKIDLLTSFWAINEKPTGSKDPFALRRASLGVIRIVIDNNLRISIGDILINSWDQISEQWWERNLPADEFKAKARFYSSWVEALEAADKGQDYFDRWYKDQDKGLNNWHDTIVELIEFFVDRLKVYLRDQGARHDLIDAVFSLGGQDDLLMIVKRVEALSDFLGSEDGASLLAGVKRGQNILRIEEGKDKTRYEGCVDKDLLKGAQEKSLNTAIERCRKAVAKYVKDEDFASAMGEIAKLRQPVDAFFDHVIVNDEDPALRKNRLELLAAMRALSLEVADFRKIEG